MSPCSLSTRRQVQHHVKEERAELFPKVRKLLSKELLEAMGREMFGFTEERKGKSPRTRSACRDEVCGALAAARSERVTS